MNDNAIDVTFLMPCLNEAVGLPHAIKSAKSAIEELKTHSLTSEILIIDNGSTDHSREVADKLGCRVETCMKRGYGSAIISGVNASRGKYIVMADADGSYDFADSVPMVLKLIDGFELCMGSRFKGKILKDAMPWKNRYIGNPVLTGLLNLLFRSGISDAHCGMRAFTKEAFLKMQLSCPGMEFASEMVVRAATLNIRRTEVPITLYPDKRTGRGHLRPWHDGKRHVKFLLMYSPLWLFFYPSIFMLFAGAILFIGLLFTPPYHTFGFGQFRFGDHWLILASGIFSIGFQGLCLGLIAFLYRSQRQQSLSSALARPSAKQLSLQNVVFLGSAMIATAIGIILYVIFEWSRAGFGALYRIREMVIATTFLVCGIQAYFSVLLAVVIGVEKE